VGAGGTSTTSFTYPLRLKSKGVRFGEHGDQAVSPGCPVARKHCVEISTDPYDNVVHSHLVEKLWHYRRESAAV
jgi:hypothetical protein